MQRSLKVRHQKKPFLLSCKKIRFHFYAFFPLFRNMLQDHKNILKCLRGKRFEDLTKYAFDTPSFLIAMGPSRDGVLIPADFDIVHKRAHSTNYQVWPIRLSTDLGSLNETFTMWKSKNFLATQILSEFNFGSFEPQNFPFWLF